VNAKDKLAIKRRRNDDFTGVKGKATIIVRLFILG